MTSNSDASIAVTGGGGFVGSRVVRLLVEAGHEVTVPIHSGHPTRSVDGSRVVAVDLTETASLKKVLEGIDVVIHLAAVSGGIGVQSQNHFEVLAANRAITSSVLDAAADAGVTRVAIASSAVTYRADKLRPLREDDPLLTVADGPSGYAWSKITDELMLRWFADRSAAETVVMRLSSVYGPDPHGNRDTVIDDLIRRAATSDHQLEVWGDGTAVRSFIYVEDAADAIAKAALKGRSGEVYNIDVGVPVTIEELAAIVRDAVNPELELRFDSAKPTGAAHRVLDPTRLFALGFAPSVDLEEGVGRTASSIVG